MKFDTVETGALRTHRSGHEVGHELLGLGRGERASTGFRIVRRAQRCLTDQILGRTMSGVVQLHDGQTVVGFDRRGEQRESGEVLVTEHAELPGETLTGALHVGGARHRETEPTLGAHHEPALLLVRQRAVGVTLHVGEWREHEPVLHTRTVRERDDIAERAHLAIIPLRPLTE